MCTFWSSFGRSKFTIVNLLLPKLLQNPHIYTGAGSKVAGASVVVTVEEASPTLLTRPAFCSKAQPVTPERSNQRAIYKGMYATV